MTEDGARLMDIHAGKPAAANDLQASVIDGQGKSGYEEDDSPKEECGIFGLYAPGVEVARLTYFGLFALQHRGQESAGIAVSDGNTIRMHKDMGLVAHIFNEDTLAKLPGHIAIGHTRYSTTGSSVLRNAQPLHCVWGGGNLAVGHNGNLINAGELRCELEAQGVPFETSNDSEVIARLIASQATSSLDEAVARTMARIKGAYSLVILSEDTLIGVRDPYGVRPLCVGQLAGGHYVLASETCALNTVGAEFIRELAPGEIVTIDKDGLRARHGQPMARHAMCMFEFIYFARPDTSLYGRELHQVRRRMGRELAREHPIRGEFADVVIPIPDTGIPAAIGFAEQSGIPYGEGVIKNRYIQRTFIQPDQRMRELGVRMKLMPIKEALTGKRVVMVDDSIVRGTTTSQIVRMLFEAGASEVHVRITAPPIKFPCFYGIDMADQDQLVAAHQSVEDIRATIGATTLGYLSIDGLSRAIGLNRDQFCLACFNGLYPIEIPDRLKVSKFALELPVSAPALAAKAGAKSPIWRETVPAESVP
ncbi:MAG: amidophosphoribosyltransferase [Capsulimonadaceae bacterium]|nr:amidophosphoribosyltransferase [Capsulimonadaceae bacterium]